MNNIHLSTLLTEFSPIWSITPNCIVVALPLVKFVGQPLECPLKDICIIQLCESREARRSVITFVCRPRRGR
jgi:hypothetical protein